MKTAPLLALALAACSTGQISTPMAVDVPIEVHCNPPVVTEPDWNVNELHPPVGVFTGVQAIVADEPLHSGYESELRAALDACRSSASLEQSPANAVE